MRLDGLRSPVTRCQIFFFTTVKIGAVGNCRGRPAGARATLTFAVERGRLLLFTTEWYSNHGCADLAGSRYTPGGNLPI